VKKILKFLMISTGIAALAFTAGLYLGAIRETERFFRMEDEEK